MKCTVFSSGSKGNVALIEKDSTRLLIDVGLSCKRIEEYLATKNINPKDINGILITHEHSDHICGLSVFMKKHLVPLYTTQKTYQRIHHSLPPGVKIHFLNKYKENNIGELVIIPFELSHDAVDPIGMVIKSEDKKYVHITDTGYLHTKHYDLIKNADVYLFESNHDIMMLRKSKYDWRLQQRIIGDYGHLSNVDATNHLVKLIGEKTHTIILAHLSEESTTEEITFNSLNSNINNEAVRIVVAKPLEALEEIHI